MIEARLLQAVRTLMEDMDQRGVSDAEVADVKATITDDAERALTTLRQLSETRRFDAHQALAVVTCLGEVSPFDKVEAAVLVYGALMNRESFHIVLAAFDDQDDQDNVCHRLGLDRVAVMRGAVSVAEHRVRGARPIAAPRVE